MIFKNKTLSVALSLLLLSAVGFSAAPVLEEASYTPEDNELLLVFSEDVQLDNILFGLISFDDDNGGPNADLLLSGATLVNPLGFEANDTVAISLLYGDIVDSFTGKFFADSEYLFELWGTNVTQVRTLEAMSSADLSVHIGF